MCQNNPNNLQNILLGLQQTSPELIELIRENENELKTLVSQPITEEDIRVFQEFNSGSMQRSGSQEVTASQGTSQQQGSKPGQTQIRVSKEEMEAVNRLKAFGFSEMEALQAYMACDKNEEYALNFLFDIKEKDFVIKVDSNIIIKNQKVKEEIAVSWVINLEISQEDQAKHFTYLYVKNSDL